MKDREPTFPGRVRITLPNGESYYATIERADEPTENGTPLNKSTLLQDETANLLQYANSKNLGYLPDNPYIYSFRFMNGEFWAYSSANEIYHSENGIDWVKETKTTPFRFDAVEYGNGIYVASGTGASNYANFAYSYDGINWTQKTISGFSNFSCCSIAYGSGRFVAVGYAPEVGSTTTLQSVYATSIDGINWVQKSFPQSLSASKVIYADGKFIVVGWKGSEFSSILFYSEDGIDWETYNMPYSGDWSDVCYGNGIFVAAASSNGETGSSIASKNFAYSYDGKVWSRSDEVPAGYSYSKITFNGEFFIAFYEGSHRAAVFSRDGIKWRMFYLEAQTGSSGILEDSGNGTTILMISQNGRREQISFSNIPDTVNDALETLADRLDEIYSAMITIL